ncbi:hypothetical protein SAMN04489800_2936 [Pseudomonas deceptionensis]|uniref:Uncharacterized protein n=1 Tax=Pseudomonas deceptionensis TaxID=882211 RepID=A0A1H5MW16_PSEDM|nr:hypothetical protein SAMN04489800_2936 [Pseudomonas deceptionensis]
MIYFRITAYGISIIRVLLEQIDSLRRCKLTRYSPYILLTCCQGDQSLITFADDADNSLSMRSVKLGSLSSMNHTAGAGGGWHSTATVCIRCGE